MILQFQTAVQVQLLDSAEDTPMYRFVFPEGPESNNRPQVLVDEKVLVEEGGVQSECFAEVERVKLHYTAVVDQLLEEQKEFLFHNENNEGNADKEESSKGCGESKDNGVQTKLLEIFTGCYFITAFFISIAMSKL